MDKEFTTAWNRIGHIADCLLRAVREAAVCRKGVERSIKEGDRETAERLARTARGFAQKARLQAEEAVGLKGAAQSGDEPKLDVLPTLALILKRLVRIENCAAQAENAIA